MRIIVAGAGAGKTTSMAKTVLDRLHEIQDGKFVYVLSYTNAARDRIRTKIKNKVGIIPKNLFIETIHVFLLREIIYPFHHLLYCQQYVKASKIKLSNNPGYKANKIKELAIQKIIHVEKASETAKWILCRKSKDKKETKEKREKVLGIISRYLDSIFIDEAQDIDKHLVEIIEKLDNKKININLVGDPKQDLRGRNAFRDMILNYPRCVEYISENHRCPGSHVILANRYVSTEEKQNVNDKSGTLNFVYESDVDINQFINGNKWDCAFIHEKNKRFATHSKDRKSAEQNLIYELKLLVQRSDIKESKVDMCVYWIKKKIEQRLGENDYNSIFVYLEKMLFIKLSSQDKGRLSFALKLDCDSTIEDRILVNSLDSIKGLEGDKCLFILTTDLADYLFFIKSNHNKTMNYLYVALTRARQDLTILVTLEAEVKYRREFINKKFEFLGVYPLI
ncbi:UvrD-helicase domain-containing protein [Sporolactobacillus terrae]|uniref:DNA helicase n=1 Tax=Sporolactobacillus terrae TaxID=269673 RepID=A0ABX5Q4P3_9BACL|nr:UvrD-helicase domain-containing protein [Sporolactobacillus terrae]QAA21584.1 hypothetical protein C0674_02505 [Sporolactobacillus terrae]QAA24556.1 hypothetical protein C0679_02485 [Sporolactobacillus terrae]